MCFLVVFNGTDIINVFAGEGVGGGGNTSIDAVFLLG